VDGAMLPAMRALLAPYLAGAWLNQRWWARKETASDEIVPGIWLGRLPRRADRDAKAIASMVDVCAELPVDKSGLAYRAVPMLDMVVPDLAQLDSAVKAIAELECVRPTLVCCAAGYSRSAAAVAAWLLASGRAASVDDAIDCIRAKRPRIVLGRRHRQCLEEWRRGRMSIAAAAGRSAAPR
jgi:protein-tyrosine phosphatase